MEIDSQQHQQLCFQNNNVLLVEIKSRDAFFTLCEEVRRRRPRRLHLAGSLLALVSRRPYCINQNGKKSKLIIKFLLLISEISANYFSV